MSEAKPSTRKGLAGRPPVKLALIGGLLLVMLLPSMWVGSVIEERQDRQSDVQSDIARSWGPAQSVLGPILVVPYRALEPQPTLPNGQAAPPVLVRSYAHVVPARLGAAVSLQPEVRKRGLFGAIVYGADIKLEGNFAVPSLTIGGKEAEYLWGEAFVVAGARDLRSTVTDSPLRWGDATLREADGPPAGQGCGTMSFLRWTLPTAPSPGQSIAFSTSLTLRGIQAFHMVPAARQLDMTIAAPWPTPSFTGAVLPADSVVTERGFEATWRDGGGVRQAVWTGVAPMTCNGAADAVNTVMQQDGVDLLEAVPTYRMVNRASKYALLFLALSFLTYFLFETLSRVRIHLMQYGLLGLSISLFPLLLLAVAEPLGFAAAYAIATAAVVLQASLFTVSVTGRAGLAGVFAAVLGLLFGFLYVVLSLESYSLLVGTVALFAVLSVVMAVTRRVDWSGEPTAA